MTITTIHDLQTRSARLARTGRGAWLRRRKAARSLFAEALGLRHSFRLIRG